MTGLTKNLSEDDLSRILLRSCMKLVYWMSFTQSLVLCLDDLGLEPAPPDVGKLVNRVVSRSDFIRNHVRS